MKKEVGHKENEQKQGVRLYPFSSSSSFNPSPPHDHNPNIQVVIRNLPPAIDEAEFLEMINKVAAGKYNWHALYKGNDEKEEKYLPSSLILACGYLFTPLSLYIYI